MIPAFQAAVANQQAAVLQNQNRLKVHRTQTQQKSQTVNQKYEKKNLRSHRKGTFRDIIVSSFHLIVNLRVNLNEPLHSCMRRFNPMIGTTFKLLSRSHLSVPMVLSIFGTDVI